MASLGIVGAGNWGKNHARLALELQEEGAIDEVLVCDADPARLKPWEGRAKTTTKLEDIADRVDAAVVATPADTHADIARTLLGAGVHLLVEKPITIRAADAKSLVALADRKGLVLGPGHIFRYHPGVLAVKNLIEDGSLGTIRYLHTVRTSFTKPRPDVGVLYSLGIHEADLYPFLVGEEYPESARADAASFHRPEIDEVAALSFRFRRDVIGFAFESWITPGGGKDRRLTVVGAKATAVVDYLQTAAITVHPTATEVDAGEPQRRTVPQKEPLRAEVEDFLKAVHSDGAYQPRADAASGYRAVRIIESLKASGSFRAPRRT